MYYTVALSNQTLIGIVNILSNKPPLKLFSEIRKGKVGSIASTVKILWVSLSSPSKGYNNKMKIILCSGLFKAEIIFKCGKIQPVYECRETLLLHEDTIGMILVL